MNTQVHDSSTYVDLSRLSVQQTLNIGERIKEERQRIGLNQADFGALAGVTKTSQLNYEKGSRNPDSTYLAAIAAAGVDVLYVLTGQRTPSKEEGLSEREKAVLDNYRALPEGDRATVQRLTHALKESKGDGTNGGEGAAG